MKLLGIDAMAVALPASQPIEELANAAGLGQEVIRTVHDNGLRSVPVARPGSFAEFAAQSAELLFSMNPQARTNISLVLLAHSSPLVCPADSDLLGEILDRVGITRAISFALTGQPCAVLHAAVQWGLDTLGDRKESAVLVLGVDRANHPRERMFFGSSMGDASVALLLGRGCPRRRIVGTYQHTELYASEGELSPPEAIQAFRECNPLLIRSAIEQCLTRAGYGLDDLTAIIPHTPYVTIWNVMADLLRYPRERIWTNYIAETGHLSSNDSFSHFYRAQVEDRLHVGDLVLLINPGFGGSRGCTLIRI
jgi:3-oxoacyl-[acyl-carrier-protein] synthase-3